jgi:diaminopimelate decarboxylase
VKALPGIRTYVAVDGGMSDNPRPVLYGSGYEAFLPRCVGAARPRTVRLVGKHCESGDVLIFDAQVPADIVVGDVLCTPVTGAYGYTMASNYNKVPRPAVVFVREGEARLVVRREVYDDLTACDVL